MHFKVCGWNNILHFLLYFHASRTSFHKFHPRLFWQVVIFLFQAKLPLFLGPQGCQSGATCVISVHYTPVKCSTLFQIFLHGALMYGTAGRTKSRASRALLTGCDAHSRWSSQLAAGSRPSNISPSASYFLTISSIPAVWHWQKLKATIQPGNF